MSLITNTIRFWTYLSLDIPSILCSSFVLYHILITRAARQNLQNHVIIVLLFLVLIQNLAIMPFYLYYFQYKGIWKRSAIFCQIWGFTDSICSMLQVILFAWTSIERHILIFNSAFLATKLKRLLFHYAPLVILILIVIIYFLIIIFFPTCQNLHDNSQPLCVYPCVYVGTRILLVELIVYLTLPGLIIFTFSIALLIRIIQQKYRIHHRIQWRNHRKSIIQTVLISILYFLFTFPYAITNLFIMLGYRTYLTLNLSGYLNFFYCFTYFLLPFVCILSLSNLKMKLREVFCLVRRQAIVHPLVISASRPLPRIDS